MACAYILFSKSNKKFYVGSSHATVESRLAAHNAGKTRSTKYGKPWIVVCEERLATYTEARKRELFLKSGVGRKWIDSQFGTLKKAF